MKVNADNRLPADPAKLNPTTAFSLYAIFRDFARAINSKQEGIQFEDEGTSLGTGGSVTEVDFTGAGVTATRSSDKVTVTIPGGHTQLHAMTSTSDHSAGNWKLFYSNGSGQVTELALGALDEVLKSAGPAAAPVFGTVTGGSGLTSPQVLARSLGA